MKVAIVSDFQVPYHDPESVRWACSVLSEFRPDILVVNGDLLDFEGISHFSNDPEHDLLDELWEGAELLTSLRQSVKRNTELWYLDGNHEYRIKCASNVLPKYLQRAVQWSQQKGCEEYSRWSRKLYHKSRKGVLRKGPLFIFHGVKTGANSSHLESFEVANFFGGGWDSQLCCFGHTHEVIQPTQCLRTQRIPIPLYYLNTGCFCDASRMSWTDKMNTSRWEPGVALIEVEGSTWEATVETP